MAYKEYGRTHGWKNNQFSHKTKTRKRKIKIGKSLLKNGILLLILLGILGSIFILAVFAFVSRDLPDPNTLTQRTIRQTTKIYDRTGEKILYEIFGDENRTLVKIQRGFCDPQTKLETDQESGIPLYAIQATIAAEDRKFCDHHGFDFKGFARAILQNLQGKRVGGSTLTQQLVKNAILSTEKTYTRKAKELILSLELERRYSKDEIMQIYFNEIPYGSTYYGIQAASLNLFNKPVHELSLAEAATLAALPQSPTRYLNNPDSLKTRRDWILSSMAELGFISQEKAEEAKNEFTPIETKLSNIKAPHFVLMIKEMLTEEYGQRLVEEGGLKVTTTIDFDLQTIADEEVARGVEENGERLGFTNASLVAIDPKNGHILAMVGSKDFFDTDIDGQVNITTRLRQPGSSFKPIVYTKAFEMGYTPNTVLWDVKTTFPTVMGDYEPNNYDLGERDPVRIRTAIQGSLNIPAVKMVYLVGVENALDFASSLGYSSFDDHSQFGLSMVLGGGEVKLLEHTNAYATFANEGVHFDPVSILKVEGPEGNILEEWKEEKGKKVIEQNIARTTSNVLSDNEARAFVFGQNSALQLGERPVAAKTGTTNDYRDAWTIGYTPSLATGVWGGNNDNSAMKRGAGGSAVAAPIWQSFMKRAFQDKPLENFQAPEIPTTGKQVLDGRLNSKSVIIDKISGKIATEYTPPALRQEALFAEYHSILHYVYKDDPTGGIPTHPEDDPYYEPWENAIQEWIVRQETEKGIKIIQQDPPTEQDDIHVPRNFPSISIEEPLGNTDFNDRNLNFSVNAGSARGVTRVEFYIDGYFLGSDNNAPFSINTTIPNTIARGFHTLKAVAYDDVENSSSDTVGVRINIDAVSGTLEIFDPKNGQTIERTVEVFNAVVSLKNPELYRLVRLYSQPIGPGSRQLIESKSNPDSPFITFDWILPEDGDWTLWADATPRDGSETLKTVGVVVHVVPSSGATDATDEPLLPGTN
ncbi:MAG: transglycosylase domain-containing protein [Patescibacteria group bacterium]